jgi:predicted nucleic acid-binding protein
MFVIQKNGRSYWSEAGREWDELSSATQFDTHDAAWEIDKKVRRSTKDSVKIITLEEATKQELDTTPFPLREEK